MRTPWAWLKSKLSARSGEDPRNQIRYILPYPVAGLNLSADDSMSLATVWACIDVIARNLASCRWNIYEPLPNSRRRVLTNDPKTWMLNNRPNPEMTAIGFREALLFQAIPFGNAFAEIVRDVGGRVIQLWPLMSDRMRITRDPKTWELRYEYTESDGSLKVLPQERIFHVRGPGMYGLTGDNVVARAAKSLAVYAAQERYSASFFGQGASPQGVLEFPHKLSREQHVMLQEDWAGKHKGPENAHKPVILESGMKYTATSFDPQKSQLTESKKFSVEEICRWFGVPPHKVQHLEHATFSNIEHSSIEFVRDALVPWGRRISQEADAKIFDQAAPWRYTEIDLRPLTYGDAQSRALAQASWRQNGIMTANEIRAMEGLDDVGDEGDVLLVGSALTTVDLILNPPQPAGGQQNAGAQQDANVQVDSIDKGAANVARAAVFAAVTGTLDRYGRRLANRRAALARKPDAERLIAEFRDEQLDVVLAELAPFDALVATCLGRTLTRADAAHLTASHERSIEVGFALEDLRALAAG